MAPQLWIAIVLFTIMLITKLVLITYSSWYESTHYAMRDPPLSIIIGHHTELVVLTITVLVNLFALYGLNCSIVGGCTVYSYTIITILVVALVLTMYSDIVAYKTSREVSKIKYIQQNK